MAQERKAVGVVGFVVGHFFFWGGVLVFGVFGGGLSVKEVLGDLWKGRAERGVLGVFGGVWRWDGDESLECFGGGFSHIQFICEILAPQITTHTHPNSYAYIIPTSNLVL